MLKKDVDVLILGAGLSGIGAACHLKRKLPGKTFAILERRKTIGGTWDLFRYPGIRSDSDMTTFGYSFRPWRAPKVLADGESIRNYVRDTAEEYEVTRHIRYERKVIRTEWLSSEARWKVTTRNEYSLEEEVWTAQFLIGAMGYYSYDEGYRPEFPGEKDFRGELVHPQFWPEDLAVKGKRMVVIGSGATAITLVPSLAERGAEVTMLQRTPTYVISVPAIDPLWKAMSKVLPAKVVYATTRIRNVLIQRLLYRVSRNRPELVKRLLRSQASKHLGGAVDASHFQPDYDPWDQRLCVVPDGDLFRVLRTGDAEIVTDTIETFYDKGILLNSGKHLEADIIVTATGLKLQLLGGAELRMDGEAVDLSQRMIYKGMMVEGLPNCMNIMGYNNASWTLKSDIVTEHFCRIIKHMDDTGASAVVPRPTTARPLKDSVLDSLNSGYVKRAADIVPRQGSEAPWQLLHDYIRDAASLKFGRLRHPDLEFLGADDCEELQAGQEA